MRRIGWTKKDELRLDRYKDDVDKLIGLTEEIFGEQKILLLSPIMRKIVLDQAVKTREIHNKIKDYLCTDIPENYFTNES